MNFLCCVNDECRIEEFNDMTKTTFKFQSPDSFLNLSSRFFGKLPRTGLGKDRIKKVLSMLAATQIQLHVKIDKVLLVDYINKCSNQKIQKIITDEFL